MPKYFLWPDYQLIENLILVFSFCETNSLSNVNSLFKCSLYFMQKAYIKNEWFHLFNKLQTPAKLRDFRLNLVLKQKMKAFNCILYDFWGVFASETIKTYHTYCKWKMKSTEFLAFCHVYNNSFYLKTFRTYLYLILFVFVLVFTQYFRSFTANYIYKTYIYIYIYEIFIWSGLCSEAIKDHNSCYLQTDLLNFDHGRIIVEDWHVCSRCFFS